MRVRPSLLLLLWIPLAAGCPYDSGSWFCDPAECGPPLGMPNVQCWDGSVGGPTDLCVRGEAGACGWFIRACPPPPAGRCGTIAGLVCDEGQVCVDVPGDGCTYPGDPDCGGTCVTPFFCGGIAAFPCPDPDRQTCVDDPRDDCDPLHGGADCSGLCVPG